MKGTAVVGDRAMTGFRPTAWRPFCRSSDGSDLIILITWIPRKEWYQAGKNFPEPRSIIPLVEHADSMPRS